MRNRHLKPVDEKRLDRCEIVDHPALDRGAEPAVGRRRVEYDTRPQATLLLLQERTPRQMMMVGAGSLFAGVTLTVFAIAHSAVVLFFLGTGVAGVGFGAGFQGAVRTVIPSAAPHERAGTLSVIFIISYLAMGVPAVAAGYMLARHVNITATAEYFCAVVMALAAAALLGATRRIYGVEATPSVDGAQNRITSSCRAAAPAAARRY